MGHFPTVVPAAATKEIAMKLKSVVTLAAAMSLALGAPQSIARDGAAKAIVLAPGIAARGAAPDAGGFSLSTGQHLTGEAAYLVVHVETADGKAHPTLGPNARGMYLFTTYDGRYVVRFMDDRPVADPVIDVWSIEN
jgi:hypothetical protein